MRADASGQFSLLVISHHLRATEVCAAAEQPLADLAQCFGWLEHVACDFTHLQNPLERQLSQHLEVKAPWRLPWRWRDRGQGVAGSQVCPAAPQWSVGDYAALSA